MAQISLSQLEKALQSLKKGFKTQPSELERDGLIQRFEFCVELCCKSAKKIMHENGVLSDSPKNIIIELGQLGWIQDSKQWLIYLDLRNQASLVYNEDMANRVFSSVEKFIHDAELLFEILKRKNT